MEVTAITHRRNPVLLTYLAQLYPNEIGSIRAMVHEHGYTEHLTKHMGIKGVIRVVPHQPLTGNRKVIFVVLRRGMPRTEIWRALHGVLWLQRASGKIIIAVNDDIDPENLDSVIWAISFRCYPHLDMEIVKHKDPGHAPAGMVRDGEDSALLIDATLKQDYPPVSLPKQDFMERARTIWERELKLPPLKPEAPWFGYSLGDWPDDLEQEAQRAVKGDYWDNGRRSAQRRRKDVAMNTDITNVDESK
jgi:4-hydroxy-3-polyprenylbenzoate decarboxylase